MATAFAMCCDDAGDGSILHGHDDRDDHGVWDGAERCFRPAAERATPHKRIALHRREIAGAATNKTTLKMCFTVTLLKRTPHARIEPQLPRKVAPEKTLRSAPNTGLLSSARVPV